MSLLVQPYPVFQLQSNMENCLNRVLKNRNEVEQNMFCNVLGLELLHDPEVFSPQCFSSTEMFAKHLPYPENGTFLEIGTGVGAIALIAAMQHDCSVVATDINPKACDITNQNIFKYRLEDKVDCRLGSLFEPLKKGEQFDLVFWNWPFIFAPENYDLKDALERSVMDPGYQTVQKFLREVKNFLKDDGKIILTFASHANEALFEQILFDNDFTKFEIAQEKIGPNVYFLYEITSLK